MVTLTAVGDAGMSYAVEMMGAVWPEGYILIVCKGREMDFDYMLMYDLIIT